MRLVEITLEGVGRFTRRTRVAGFGEAVNVLSAPNEFGKSTIFTALRACILERHNSRNETLRRLVSYGGNAPVSVTVVFDHGDIPEGGQPPRYTISKSFMKTPSAVLKRDGVLLAQGREADEKVWELLGIVPGVGRAACDEAGLGVLWVSQGQSFSPVDLTPGGKSMLATSIESEIGMATDGGAADTLLANIEEDLGELVTAAGRPRAGRKLATALKALETVTADVTEIEQRLAATVSQQADLVSTRSERLKLSDPAERARLTSDLRYYETFLEEGRQAAETLATATALHATLSNAETTERQALAQARDAAARIDGARKQEIELQAERVQLDAAAAAATGGQEAVTPTMLRGRIVELDTKLRALDQQERDIAACVRAASAGPAAARRAAAVSVMDLDARAQTLETALTENPVTAAMVKTATDLVHEIEALNERLEAGGTEIIVHPLGLDRGAIRFDGVPMPSTNRRMLTEPTNLTLGDLVRIEINPAQGARKAGGGAKAAKDAAVRRDAARSELLDLLHRCGVTRPRQGDEPKAESPGNDNPEARADLLDAVRRQRAARELLEAGQHRIKIELDVQVAATSIDAALVETRTPSADLTLGTLRAMIRSVQEAIATALRDHDSATRDLLERLGRSSRPDQAALDEWQGQIAESRTGLQSEKARLEGQLDAAQALRQQQATARGVLEGRLSEIRSRLAADLIHLPDAEREVLLTGLDARLAAARDKAQAQALIVQELTQEAPSRDEIERRQSRVARLRDALENMKTRAADLDRTIANLEGQLQNAGGEGLGEKLAALKQTQGLYERDVQRHRRIVASLTLLRDTITQARTERQQRLSAPLLRYLRPLLADVFGKAALVFDEDYTPIGLQRNGGEAQPGGATQSRFDLDAEDAGDMGDTERGTASDSEPFRYLSLGTQEQVAILVRLAMGGLIAEQIGPVPVILDDSLAYADDDRIDAMFDAYARAARGQQVIVLSCRSRAYAGLGGTPLIVEEF